MTGTSLLVRQYLDCNIQEYIRTSIRLFEKRPRCKTPPCTDMCKKETLSRPKANDTSPLVKCDQNIWKIKTSGAFCQWKGNVGTVYIYQLVPYFKSVYDYAT